MSYSIFRCILLLPDCYQCLQYILHLPTLISLVTRLKVLTHILIFNLDFSKFALVLSKISLYSCFLTSPIWSLGFVKILP